MQNVGYSPQTTGRALLSPPLGAPQAPGADASGMVGPGQLRASAQHPREKQYLQILQEEIEVRDNAVRQHHERIAAYNRSLAQPLVGPTGKPVARDSAVVMARKKALIEITWSVHARRV